MSGCRAANSFDCGSPGPAHMEHLTRLLHACRPVYRDKRGEGAGTFLEALQHELNTPIGLASFGPTAGDKLNLP